MCVFFFSSLASFAVSNPWHEFSLYAANGDMRRIWFIATLAHHFLIDYIGIMAHTFDTDRQTNFPAQDVTTFWHLYHNEYGVGLNDFHCVDSFNLLYEFIRLISICIFVVFFIAPHRKRLFWRNFILLWMTFLWISWSNAISHDKSNRKNVEIEINANINNKRKHLNVAFQLKFIFISSIIKFGHKIQPKLFTESPRISWRE